MSDIGIFPNIMVKAIRRKLTVLGKEVGIHKEERKFAPGPGTMKQTCDSVLISNKAVFKLKLTIRDKGHYIVIQGTITQEDTPILSIYALNYCTYNSLKRH